MLQPLCRRHPAFSEWMRMLASWTCSTAQHNGKSIHTHRADDSHWIARHFTRHINRDIVNFQRGGTAMLSILMSAPHHDQWDQTNTMCNINCEFYRCLDNDRMVQMLLKQELVAHQVATKTMSRPGAETALSIRVVEATGTWRLWKNYQDHNGYRTFFDGCRACLFIDVTAQPLAPSRKRGSWKTNNWSSRWHWCRSSHAQHWSEVTRFSCDGSTSNLS